MKVDYKTPLQVTARSLRHYHQIETQVEETRGTDFFPEAEFPEKQDMSSASTPKCRRYLPSITLP